MESENKKPFKVKDITRNIKKAVVASSLEEIRAKVSEKFEKLDQLPTIHLDSDGTEIDDEEYFRTLDENAELIAVFPGEHWIDPSHYVEVTNPNDQTDATMTDVAAKTARIKQLVGQLQNNLCNVSVMSDPDLDSLSNMDPNSLVDITGKDFMEQLKDSGRPLCAKRNAQDRINLLKLLKEGAIFCSERYPEDAEAIDMEIRRQLNEETYVDKANNAETTEQDQNIMQLEDINETMSTTTTSTTIMTNTKPQQTLITIVVDDTTVSTTTTTTPIETSTPTTTTNNNNNSNDAGNIKIHDI
ncbi:DNA fragmentation factor subunit alpha-like [Glossina fuscipes fuscipes]